MNPPCLKCGSTTAPRLKRRPWCDNVHACGYRRNARAKLIQAKYQLELLFEKRGGS